MPRENGQNTEIIDLINPKLEFEPIDNIPARSGSVGGLGTNMLPQQQTKRTPHGMKRSRKVFGGL